MSSVLIPVGSVLLEGELCIPEDAGGLVIFSHGSGSSRFSPRNQMVARKLLDNGFATLLFDLLTEEEDKTFKNRFDIELLSERLVAATLWARKKRETKNLHIGYFGASTGAASALYAAAELGDTIKAVVSRGGRPDLAMEALSKVKAATLLIVGGFDAAVIDLNHQAFEELKSEKELQIVNGASHLFEEPGKLETVAELAAEWFSSHLSNKAVLHHR